MDGGVGDQGGHAVFVGERFDDVDPAPTQLRGEGPH